MFFVFFFERQTDGSKNEDMQISELEDEGLPSCGRWLESSNEGKEKNSVSRKSCKMRFLPARRAFVKPEFIYFLIAKVVHVNSKILGDCAKNHQLQNQPELASLPVPVYRFSIFGAFFFKYIHI